MTELTAAIPAVLFAVAAVGAVVAVGKLLWGWRAGLVAGLILATAPPLFVFGHLAPPDMMLASWMTWSLYWYLRAWRSGWTRAPLIGFYLCVGLAVASKGPAGYAALAGALAATVGTEGIRGLGRVRPVLGLLILALCALPWLVPYHLQSQGQFDGHVLAGHYVTWYFHGALLERIWRPAGALVSFLPWTIFLAVAPWWWRGAPDAGRRAVGFWALALGLLLGFSGTPRARYLVPVYPLFALLTGEFLARAESRDRGPVVRVAAALFAFVAIAWSVGVIFPPLRVGERSAFFPDAPWEQAIGVAVALLGGVATWLLARRGAFGAMVVMAALSLAGLLVLNGVAYPPRYARDNDVRPLAAAAAAYTEPGVPVIGYPDLRLSYDFYLRRPVVEIASDAQMMMLLGAPPRQAVIMPRERWRVLAPGAGPSWRVLAARTVGRREMVVVGGP